MENAIDVVDGFGDARARDSKKKGNIGIDVDINLLKWGREASSRLYLEEWPP